MAPLTRPLLRNQLAAMKRFLYLGKYTAEGLRGLAEDGGTRRRDATEKLISSIGGTILEYEFAVGEYDFVLMVEVADDTAGLVAPILTGATGTVRVVTVPLVSPRQIDEVVSRVKSATFRPAGSH